MLRAEIVKLSESHFLHVIDIKEIDDCLKSDIDDFLVIICEGDSDSELGNVKEKILDLFNFKSNEFVMGAVAEFICHLYLNLRGYKQNFLYFNLEERSIKKGFDGVFSIDETMFLVESKSGLYGGGNVNHRSKIKSAHKDLSNYVEGKSKKSTNNPWRNAYNHASHIDVGANKTLRKRIKALKKSYEEKCYSSINDFNVVPCSTIYLDGAWDDEVSLDVLQNSDFVTDLAGMTVTGICVTKLCVDLFLEYLRA